jgi:hypothetical protein
LLCHNLRFDPCQFATRLAGLAFHFARAAIPVRLAAVDQCGAKQTPRTATTVLTNRRRDTAVCEHRILARTLGLGRPVVEFKGRRNTARGSTGRLIRTPACSTTWSAVAEAGRVLGEPFASRAVLC